VRNSMTRLETHQRSFTINDSLSTFHPLFTVSLLSFISFLVSSFLVGRSPNLVFSSLIHSLCFLLPFLFALSFALFAIHRYHRPPEIRDVTISENGLVDQSLLNGLAVSSLSKCQDLFISVSELHL
jgi:hypothetical protein